MKFIRVHLANAEKEINLNINAIESVIPYVDFNDTKFTRICMITEDKSYFDVAESVDEVMQMIRRAEFCLT